MRVFVRRQDSYLATRSEKSIVVTHRPPKYSGFPKCTIKLKTTTASIEALRPLSGPHTERTVGILGQCPAVPGPRATDAAHHAAHARTAVGATSPAERAQASKRGLEPAQRYM